MHQSLISEDIFPSLHQLTFALLPFSFMPCASEWSAHVCLVPETVTYRLLCMAVAEYYVSSAGNQPEIGKHHNNA